MMAQHNKGQPLAYRQKVVNLPKVVKHKRTGRSNSPQSLIASLGNNDGGQPKPKGRPGGIISLGDNLGSFSLDAVKHTLSRQERFGTWNVTGLGNRETELEMHR